jgi:hypothetical protein
LEMKRPAGLMASTFTTVEEADVHYSLILKSATPPVSNETSPALHTFQRDPLDRPIYTQPQSPLLSLPAELRNQIYAYVLTPPADLLQHHRRHRALLGGAPGPRIASAYSAHAHLLAPAILAVCRQVYLEALPFLYARNVFVAHSRLLTKRPYLLDPARPVRPHSQNPAARIRKWEIEVSVDVEAAWTTEELVAAFEGSDELTVRVSRLVEKERGAHGVLGMFLAIRGVQKARLEGFVDEGLARWVADVMMLDREASQEECPAFVETIGV